MKRNALLLAIGLVCMSGQVCGVRVNVNTGTTLDDANAIVTIRRTAGQAQAAAPASAPAIGPDLSDMDSTDDS